jgi:hypothetical protein
MVLARAAKPNGESHQTPRHLVKVLRLLVTNSVQNQHTIHSRHTPTM